jgi:diguanylate cyclase (GGDEF)-like protein/PAS domain S-box-containing protein
MPQLYGAWALGQLLWRVRIGDDETPARKPGSADVSPRPELCGASDIQLGALPAAASFSTDGTGGTLPRADQGPRRAREVVREPVSTTIMKTSLPIRSISGRFARRMPDTAPAPGICRSLFEHAPVGMVVLTLDGHLIGYNSAFSRLVGYDGVAASAVLYGDVLKMWPSLFDEGLLRRLATGAVDERRQFVREDGTLSIVRVLLGTTPAQGDSPALVIAQVQCITDQTRQETRLRRLAERDCLTGLVNRRKLLEILDIRIDRLASDGEDTALAIIDLNGFKDINDNSGHAQGDVVLQTVALSLRRRVRMTDSVARLGGDEFAVVLTGAPPETLEEWRYALADAVASTRLETPVTASVGIASLELDDSPADVLRRADEAMYRTKRSDPFTNEL